MFNRYIQIGTPKTRFYKNIMIRANPSLHDEAFDKLRSIIPAGAKILDLGTGQGAFAQRLHDSGYIVIAADMNPEDFKATGIEYRTVNFDSIDDVANFKKEYAGHFDAVVGMEVIEHVENPWDYIRLIKPLLKKTGVALITTPNIESAFSKIEFLFCGNHYHFTHSDYVGSGHINPLTILEIEIILQKENLILLNSGTMCLIPKFIVTRNIKVMLFGLINVLFGWAFGSRANGDIVFVTFKNCDNA